MIRIITRADGMGKPPGIAGQERSPAERKRHDPGAAGPWIFAGRELWHRY